MPKTTYGEKLRAHLETTDVSVRGLARRLDPENPEAPRRQLNRILAGRKPRPDTREKIAAALGVPRQVIEGEDEDEEEDPLAVLLVRVQKLLSERTLARSA